MSTTGERIYQLRNHRGMTQSDLAEAIGETKQTIYKYERGIVTNIPLSKIEAIAKVLRCPPSILTGWEEQKIPQSEQTTILAESEFELVEKYRQLTELNKGRVLQQIDTLLDAQSKAAVKSINSVG